MEGLGALFTPGIMTAAGGIVVSIYAIWRFSGVIEKLMGNHVNHNTEAIHRLAETLEKTGKEEAAHRAANIEVMRRFSDILEKKLQ